jgi:hypothetical protein
MNKTEEYIGLLRIGNIKKSAGKALLLIEFVNGVPTDARIYLVGRQSSSIATDLANSNSFSLKAPSLFISLKFSGKRHSSIPLFNTSSQAWTRGMINHIDICTITTIGKLNENNKGKFGTQIIAQLSPIAFLKHNLSWFLYESTKNLDRLSLVREKYEFDFDSVGYNCKLSPFLLGDTDMDDNIVNLNSMNVLTFHVPKSSSNEKALNLLKPKTELLLRVLGFLDNRQLVISHLKSETTIENLEYSYEEWNQHSESSKPFSIPRLNVKEYLSTANRIYYVISTLPDSFRHKIFITFKRFLMASENEDLSISIALYHVVFCSLLCMLENRPTDISSKKLLNKIFRKHSIKYDSEDINALIKFNDLRNTVFKKLDPNFKYSSDVYNNMNRVLLILGRLFSRFFQLDELGEKVVESIVKDYHCLNVVKK